MHQLIGFQQVGHACHRLHAWVIRLSSRLRQMLHVLGTLHQLGEGSTDGESDSTLLLSRIDSILDEPDRLLDHERSYFERLPNVILDIVPELFKPTESASRPEPIPVKRLPEPEERRRDNYDSPGF